MQLTKIKQHMYVYADLYFTTHYMLFESGLTFEAFILIQIPHIPSQDLGPKK